MRALFYVTLLSFLLFADTQYANLERIKDGDTMVFRANGKEITCRLNGIDTPEKFGGAKLNKDADKVGVGRETLKQAGEEATAYAKKSLKVGKNYKVDIEKNDRYGRSLCWVYDGGESFNKAIIADGYAVVYQSGKFIKDEKTKRELLMAEREAKAKNKGLWSGASRRIMEGMAR